VQWPLGANTQREGAHCPAEKIAKWAAEMAPLTGENSYQRSVTRTEVCKMIVERAERMMKNMHMEHYLKKIDTSDGSVVRDWNWETNEVR